MRVTDVGEYGLCTRMIAMMRTKQPYLSNRAGTLQGQ